MLTILNSLLIKINRWVKIDQIFFLKMHTYGWFRQLLTSVCTSPSSIWLPLRESLLSPKSTLREFVSDFFKASLTTLYTHWIIEFSKMLISNHFLLGLWILKKNVKTHLYVKKSHLFEKNIIFPIALQGNTQNRKLTLKMCFWGSSATSILNFIFFLKN